MACSRFVVEIFIMYVLNRKEFDIKYLSCEDATLLLPIYWDFEEYKATHKDKVSLTIEEYHATTRRSHNNPYISISSKRGVTISYENFVEGFSPVELIEQVGLLLTDLKIMFSYPNFTSTRAMFQGYVLDYVFEHCPFLKRIECSFYFLQSCNPELSISTSIEELVLTSVEIHPTVLEQLSIRLPNLKIVSFRESAHIGYDGRRTSKRKLEINMKYTKFEKLYIARKATKKYSKFFLKYSNDYEDKYFYANINSDFTELIKSSKTDYINKSATESTCFLNLQCQDVRELIIQLESRKIKFVA